MSTSHPAWLKRMQNGSIGEARARAFLIDRFWILERSVDIEGADFIIQRRITTHSLFDLRPPRLGLVQAKFIQDEKTDIYIHSEYVKEKTGEPHPEFFLLVSTGYEDRCVMHLLSAEDIMQNFAMVEPGLENAGKYKLPGKTLFNNKFKVASPRLSLERMEASLNLADIVKNHRFMFPFVSTEAPKEAAIAPKYSEKIDNAYASNIPKTFFTIKKDARRWLEDVEEAKGYLEDIVTSIDPLIALKAAKDFDSMLTVDGRLSLGRLYDKEFEDEVNEYSHKLALLKQHNLLDNYILLREKGEKLISEHLCTGEPWNKQDVCLFECKLDNMLNVTSFGLRKEQEKHSLPNNGTVQVIASDAETIELCFSFVPAVCRWSFSDTYQENPTWEQTVLSNARVWTATILFTVFSWIEQDFCSAEKLDVYR
ncbi:hypothetical protein [Massilia sp. BHUDP2]|uniref:hypothetical protein n=1 Tax=Massilia sp. BHUDP2 TaxID=3034505 RepID=UPI003905AF45